MYLIHPFTSFKLYKKRGEFLSICLSCRGLHVSFKLAETSAKAVRGVSFDIEDKTTLGVVGESGCGKSLTALSIMRLVPVPGYIEHGDIYFDNCNLLKLPESEIRKIRGKKISMIFQDPMTSLNPVYTCGQQVLEVIEQHHLKTPIEKKEYIENLLSEVGIADPGRTYTAYPHQLSGGMRQRVMIAMALACSPKLLIADEPTTALDVTVQARILDLLHHLQQKKSMSMMLITHNLGLVGDIANKIIVMYAGEIVEFASTEDLFNNPLHPYTTSLLKTIPHLDKKKCQLKVIPGEVPTIRNIPQGCPFHPRCEYAKQKCKTEIPKQYTPDSGHSVRCFLYE